MKAVQHEDSHFAHLAPLLQLTCCLRHHYHLSTAYAWACHTCV